MLIALLVSTGNADGMVWVEGGVLRPAFPAAPEITEIQIAPFYVDRMPVTNGKFLRFVKTRLEWRRGNVPALFAESTYLSHWKSPLEAGDAGLENKPVTHVSWFAARAYCAAYASRLLTWQEWEYLAAASATQKDARKDEAWQQNILDWYAKPAGQVPPDVAGPPNYFGVSGIHGTIWEWVEDFNSLLVAGDSRESGGADRQFCGAGALAAREKSSYAVFMRVAFLSSLQANYTTSNLGFRCAKNAPGK